MPDRLPHRDREKWINTTGGTKRGGVPTEREPVIPLDPFPPAYA